LESVIPLHKTEAYPSYNQSKLVRAYKQNLAELGNFKCL
jgi:hypothetical protein